MKKSCFAQWWRPAVALGLLVLVGLLDQMMRREYSSEAGSPLADFVDKITAAQREKEGLRARVADGEEAPVERLKAAEKLLKLYAEDSNGKEARQVARTVVSQLAAKADVSRLIEPCQKLLTRPDDVAWLLEQWRLSVVATASAADYQKRLVQIAEKAAAAQRADLAVNLVKDVFVNWPELPATQRAAVLQQLAPLLLATGKNGQAYASAAPTLRNAVSENWRAWWGNPVDAAVLEAIAQWHRIAHNGEQSAAAQWAEELLGQVAAAVADPESSLSGPAAQSRR